MIKISVPSRSERRNKHYCQAAGGETDDGAFSGETLQLILSLNGLSVGT